MSIPSSSALYDENECEDHIALFAHVLTSINIEALPAVALAVRKQKPGLATTNIDCKVLSPPLFGSYNIVFPLEFTDGCRWILKVPSTGYRECYDDIAARALVAEAMTMQMLKRETRIPLPKVHLFDACMDNELNCPFILMDYIEGVPLSELWFNHTSTMTTNLSVEQFRAVILMDLAEAMVQLSKYNFDEGGSPLFDEEGSLTGVGPAKIVDLPAMLGRIPKGDPDQSAIFYESGPWTEPQQFFFDMLSRHQPSRYKFDKGLRKLLRLFIGWIPYKDHRIEDTKFVLAHPDYSLQNIMVSKEGRLCGIVDWDGVAAVPRCVGCEQYPNWLTTDWDPARYTYDVTRPNYRDDSPEELNICRKMYRRSMEAASQISDVGFGKLRDDDNRRLDPKSSSCLEMTRISLLATTLSMAAKDSMSIDEIISSLFDRITQITAMDWDKVAPDTEQPESSSARVEDDHSRNTEATKKSGGSHTDATEMKTLDPLSGQPDGTNDGLLALDSNTSHSLPSNCTTKGTVGTSRFGLIQKVLRYAIEWFHRRDPDQQQTRSNWGINLYRQGSWTTENLQDLADLNPDALRREVCRRFEKVADHASWPAEHHDVIRILIRKLFGKSDQEQESVAADENTLPTPAGKGPPQDTTISSADPLGTPVAEVVVDESYHQFFILWDIVHALADDFLDDAHMKRLKQGFEAIAASLQQPDEFEGYQHLVDQVVEEKAMPSRAGNWVRKRDGI